MWHIKGAAICCLFSLHLYSICVSAGLQTNPPRQICINYEFGDEIRATEEHTWLTRSGYISPPTCSIGRFLFGFFFFTMKSEEDLSRCVWERKRSFHGFNLYESAIQLDSARFHHFLYHERRAYLDPVPFSSGTCGLVADKRENHYHSHKTAPVYICMEKKKKKQDLKTKQQEPANKAALQSKPQR